MNTTGRFLHIEQEYTKLRKDSLAWNRLYKALANVFPCSIISSTSPISIPLAYKIYPNPASSHLYIEAKNIEAVQLWTLDGRLCYIQDYKTSKNIIRLKLDAYEKGLYILKINTEKQNISTKFRIE